MSYPTGWYSTEMITCKQKNVEIIMKPKLSVGIGRCAAGHTRVIFLDDVEHILNALLTKEDLLEESNYQDLHIIARAFEEILIKNDLKWSLGSRRSGSVLNMSVSFPLKNSTNYEKKILASLSSVDETTEIFSEFEKLTKETSFEVHDLTTLKQCLHEIGNYNRIPYANIDEELLNLNKRILELSKEWMEKTVPQMYKDKEKEYEDWLKTKKV